MLFELRHYVAYPDKSEQLQERFLNSAIPLFQQHGITLVNLWRESGQEHEFWYLLEFQDREHRDQAWQAFRTDPRWQSAKSASEAGGPLVMEQISHFLSPGMSGPEFSPVSPDTAPAQREGALP